MNRILMLPSLCGLVEVLCMIGLRETDNRVARWGYLMTALIVSSTLATLSCMDQIKTMATKMDERGAAGMIGIMPQIQGETINSRPTLRTLLATTGVMVSIATSGQLTQMITPAHLPSRVINPDQIVGTCQIKSVFSRAATKGGTCNSVNGEGGLPIHGLSPQLDMHTFLKVT